MMSFKDGQKDKANSEITTNRETNECERFTVHMYYFFILRFKPPEHAVTTCSFWHNAAFYSDVLTLSTVGCSIRTKYVVVISLGIVINYCFFAVFEMHYNSQIIDTTI